jgi:hypothetical protein
MKSAIVMLALLAAPAPSVHILTADLKPETVKAFERYVQATEVRIRKEEQDPNAFLYFDSLSAPDARRVKILLHQGQIFTQRLRTFDSSGSAIPVPGGFIHHWIGIVFIPDVSLDQVLDTVQDYEHQQDYYRPRVIRSRLISHHGDDYQVYLRLQEKRVVTVTLDTDHDIRYERLDATHWSSRSYSTRIQEVVDAGEPDEHLMPVGHGGGFLWRIDSYWRFEQADGGVYVQCESISLTRDIPTGLGWMLDPFVKKVPREMLQATLASTRAAVEHRKGK